MSAKGPVLYTFVESVVFTKQLQELASIETYMQFRQTCWLIQNDGQ